MAAKKTETEFDAMNPEAYKAGYDKFAEGVSKFADFQKQNVEAFMTAANAFAKGVEQAASVQTAFVKEAYEDGVAAAKSASTSKSVQEAFEVQSEFARAAIEKNLGFASKMADHWTGVTKTATDPLTKRYGEFVELVQGFRP